MPSREPSLAFAPPAFAQIAFAPLAFALVACAPPAPRPTPPHVADDPAPDRHPVAATEPPALALPAPASASPAPAPEPPAPQPPPEPTVHIELETPYKLDERPPPKTQEEYKRDILDQRHWNGGGVGELVGEMPGVDNHPDPRVIVNIEKIAGREERPVLVFARKYHWIEVVRCYRLGAYKDPYLRGWTRARVKIAASGKVTESKMLETELDDENVARCMVERLASHTFPPGAATVTFAMRVGPGDEPMPPPDDLIVPGEGELPLEAMTAGVEAGREAFEACYRAAFAYAPGLWGRMILRFHLTEHGKLDEAFQVNRRFPDPRVSQCVEHAARKLTFPRPEGGEIRFVVPLRLWTDRSDTKPPE